MKTLGDPLFIFLLLFLTSSVTVFFIRFSGRFGSSRLFGFLFFFLQSFFFRNEFLRVDGFYERKEVFI